MKIKRRQVEKEIEEREDLEMREKKAETDKLFQLYQQEKDKKRRDDAQILSQTHLQQAVRSIRNEIQNHFLLFSMNERIVNMFSNLVNSMKHKWINMPVKSNDNSIRIMPDVSLHTWKKMVEIRIR